MPELLDREYSSISLNLLVSCHQDIDMGSTKFKSSFPNSEWQVGNLPPLANHSPWEVNAPVARGSSLLVIEPTYAPLGRLAQMTTMLT